jgi:hypothetical protein
VNGLARSTVSMDSYRAPPPSRWHRLKWVLFGWLIMWPDRRRAKKAIRQMKKLTEE